MNFVILGYGRSGTKYMAHLMQHFGYLVGHEEPLKHGISAMDATRNSATSRAWGLSYCGRRRRLLYRSDPQTKTIHVVRNPWHVIESDYGLEAGVARGVAQWFSHINQLQGITRVIRSLLLISELIEQMTLDLTLRVESAEPTMRRWLRDEKLFIGTHGRPPGTKTGHKPHRRLSAQDWSSADQGAVAMLGEHALRYGYP